LDPGSVAARKQARSGAVAASPAAALRRSRTRVQAPLASCGQAIATVRRHWKLLAFLPGGPSTLSLHELGEPTAGKLL